MSFDSGAGNSHFQVDGLRIQYILVQDMLQSLKRGPEVA